MIQIFARTSLSNSAFKKGLVPNQGIHYCTTMQKCMLCSSMIMMDSKYIMFKYVCVSLQMTRVYVAASPNAVDAIFNNKSLTVLQKLNTLYKQQLDIVEKLRKENTDKRRFSAQQRII